MCVLALVYTVNMSTHDGIRQAGKHATHMFARLSQFLFMCMQAQACV